MAGSRLTWHTGSILPFASLWHTLMRVAALNSLRIRELPDADIHRHPGAGSHTRSCASLLYNESSNRRGESISTHALARWLGEPIEVFEWSHLGRIPKGLRGISHDGFRVCPECLAAGYHSALMSLRPLQACPIHGCELLGHCQCGRAFDGRIDGKVLSRALSCACGKWVYFTKQTCRRPMITADEVFPLDPVARWLESFIAVGHPQFGNALWTASVMPHWWDDLMEWSDVLGIDYPKCFKTVPGPSGRRVVSTRGSLPTTTTSALHSLSRQIEPIPARQQGSYWETNPATSAYRGMLRHLRRHVSRGSDLHAIDFLSNPDPERIARVMRSNQQAVVAFAELLWSTSLEQDVMRRRWPYRAIEQGYLGDFVGQITSPTSWDQDIMPPWQGHAWHHWVQYQSCRSMMLSYWREAQQRALDAVRTGYACLDPLLGVDAFKWATVHNHQSIRFVSLESQQRWDWTLPRPDKARRCKDQCGAAVQRLRAIEDVCAGPCLTWNQFDGWHVTASMSPCGTRTDRHRLLGVGNDKPRFCRESA